MSNALAKIRKRQQRNVHSLRLETSADAKARAIAKKAFEQHRDCLDKAHHELSAALVETDANERAVSRIVRGPWPSPPGAAADVVALVERLEDGSDRVLTEVMVATAMEPFQATVDSIASVVRWTTRVAHVGRDEDGRTRFVEIYNVTTTDKVA